MGGSDDEEARAGRADERSRRAAQSARDREAVWTEIASSAKRTDENTARLRDLRLEKERADAAAAAEAAAAAKPKPAPRKRKPALPRRPA